MTTSTSNEETSRRAANERPVDLPIPDGWFAVSWSKDLETGAVKRIRYFDQDLVLFRTRSGQPVVLDAYCPHLGAHLGEGGRVMGETLRCPFHGWQYGTDGRCETIPYCERIPPRARVHSWPVVERNRMILVWYHALGEPPAWEVPVMEELEDERWTEPRYFDLEVGVHMQDMAENNCDPVHFLYVHGNPTIEKHHLEFGDDGRFMRVRSYHQKQTPYGEFEIELLRDTWGLGLSAVRMGGLEDAGLLMFSSTTAIDAGHTHSRWLFTTTEDFADTAGEDFIAGLSTGVLQDFRIWENKIHRREPLLCEGDELLGEFRRWVKQFYSAPVDP